MDKKCTLPNVKSPTDVLLAGVRRDIDELMKTTTARLLKQDGKIAELCVYIKDNLSGTIAELFDTMKYNGDLAEILTDIVLAGVLDDIDKTNVYFDGIESEKNVDTVSATTYYVTRIPKFDKNGLEIKLKLGVANDDETGGTLESTIDFAHRKNATVCVNAGVYDVSTNYPIGTLIKDGEILYTATPTEDKYQFLAIKYDGTIKNYPRGTSPETMLSEGVTDCVCIFASLIENGVLVPQTDIRKEPRQSIGIKEDGTIVFIACDGRTYESEGMSYDDLARLHYAEGCLNAYILDGGGSVSTVVHGVKQNENIDYYTVDRKVNTFLYVARETNVTPDNNPSNDIGIVKQYLNEKIMNKVDFLKGYIRLRGGENYFAPGIEMYVNAETSRRVKIGLSFDKNNVRNTYLYLSLKADATERTNIFRIYDAGVLMQTYHGLSSSRPNAQIGACYYDESLKKPIWYDGTAWRDANGSTV